MLSLTIWTYGFDYSLVPQDPNNKEQQYYDEVLVTPLNPELIAEFDKTLCFDSNEHRGHLTAVREQSRIMSTASLGYNTNPRAKHGLELELPKRNEAQKIQFMYMHTVDGMRADSGRPSRRSAASRNLESDYLTNAKGKNSPDKGGSSRSRSATGRDSISARPASKAHARVSEAPSDIDIEISNGLSDGAEGELISLGELPKVLEIYPFRPFPLFIDADNPKPSPPANSGEKDLRLSISNRSLSTAATSFASSSSGSSARQQILKGLESLEQELASEKKLLEPPRNEIKKLNSKMMSEQQTSEGSQ